VAVESVTVKISAVMTGGFLSQFTRADAAVKGLRSGVMALDRTLITFRRNIETTATALGLFNKEMGMFSRAMASSTGTNAATAHISRLRKEVNDLTLAYRRLQAAQKTAGPSTRGVGPGGGGGMMGHDQSGLMRRAGYGLTHAGMFMGMGGALGLYGFERAARPAADYQHQMAQMGILGMKQSEVTQAMKAAWKTSLEEVPIFSASQNLEAFRELRMVFRSSEEAMKHLGTVQKVQGVMGALLGQEGGEQAYTLAKAMELRKATDAKEFEMEANMMTKAIIASGGKLQATDFQSAFKYGKAATLGWSNEFAYTLLPTLMQQMKTAGGTMGGGGVGGPGNALMTVYNAIVGGHIQKNTLSAFQDLGLINKGGLVTGKKGQPTGLKAGGVKGTELFAANPFEWVQQYLKPALEKKGIFKEGMSKEELNKTLHPYLAHMFGGTARNVSFVIQSFLENAALYKGDQSLINQAGGIDAFEKLMKTDPHLMWQAVKEQAINTFTVIGATVLPSILHGFEMLTHGLERTTAWFRRMSEAHTWFAPLVKSVLLGGAAFSALAVVAGALLGTLGLMAISITGINEALLLLGLRAAPAATAGLASLAGVSGAGGAIGSVGTGLSRVLPMLGRFGLWGAVIAGTGYLVYKNWDKVGPMLQGVG
jgi:hypothetical protein